MANLQFHLEIVSPDGIAYKDDIEELSLPTTQGEITILPHHASLYSKLKEGEAVVTKGGKKNVIAILGGMVEVGKNTVNIITDYAIRAESIEMARAEEAKKRAEEVIKSKAESVDYAMIDRDLKKSILELKVAQKYKKRSPQM